MKDTAIRKITVLISYLIFLNIFPNSILANKVDYIQEMENNDLRIRQIPETETQLAKYLKPLDIEEDTIYAILYIPAECYRCEAAIPAFYKKLKHNNSNNKMLLISAYRDSLAAAGYNRKNNYKADYYLYDTDESYTKFFSFNSVSLYGLHILKICPKTGILITGGQYTLLGKEFINQLVACKKRLTPHIYPGNIQNEDSMTEVLTPPTPYPWIIERMPIELSKDMFISNVYDIPKFENGNFFFTDMLNNGIMFFQEKDNQLVYKTLFQANEKEKKQFISVPDNLFEDLVKQGQVFYISLSANMIDKQHLAISYSLPKIFGEKNGEEYNLSFYNSPAILIRDIQTFQPGKMLTPDFELASSDYFYMHFAFDLFNDKLWFGCQKLTWPMDGFEKGDIEGDIRIDPFNDKFYTTPNPIIASFNISNGKCDGHYGKLEECQKRSKTGYYFLNNVFAHNRNEFLYGNGYTGKLYVCDSTDIGNKSQCYPVFDIDLSSLPQPDSTKFYQLEYGSLYNKDFHRCITAVKMNDQAIYCLVKYGKPRFDDLQKDRYSFIVVDRQSGHKTEYPLPAVASGTRCLGYGIRVEEDKFNPFVFLQKGSDFFIENLKLTTR